MDKLTNDRAAEIIGAYNAETIAEALGRVEAQLEGLNCRLDVVLGIRPCAACEGRGCSKCGGRGIVKKGVRAASRGIRITEAGRKGLAEAEAEALGAR